MNMFFKFPLCMTVVTIMATSMISCSDNNNGSNTSNGLSDEEQALKEAIVPYVDNFPSSITIRKPTTYIVTCRLTWNWRISTRS